MEITIGHTDYRYVYLFCFRFWSHIMSQVFVVEQQNFILYTSVPYRFLSHWYWIIYPFFKTLLASSIYSARFVPISDKQNTAISKQLWFAKNTSLETKFHSPFGSENFSSLDLYFSQIPLPNMIYLFGKKTRKKNFHELKK
jgi:hypothetical protein